MEYIIITGATRGLGKALVEKISKKDKIIFIISRNSEDLEKVKKLMWEKNKVKVLAFSYDLNDYTNITTILDLVYSKINIDICSRLTFINNAGTINPIKAIGKFSENEIQNNLSTNFLTPMLIVNQLVKYTKENNMELKIINISSGAYKHPIDGWSLYCASKAAMHMIMEVLEKENRNNPQVKAISIDPGVMDTDIQASIRKSSKKDFSDVDYFISLLENNKLRRPEDVAEVINKNFIDKWNTNQRTFVKIDEFLR